MITRDRLVKKVLV